MFVVDFFTPASVTAFRLRFGSKALNQARFCQCFAGLSWVAPERSLSPPFVIIFIFLDRPSKFLANAFSKEIRNSKRPEMSCMVPPSPRECGATARGESKKVKTMKEN
jgi:hypothetical protein